MSRDGAPALRLALAFALLAAGGLRAQEGRRDAAPTPADAPPDFNSQTWTTDQGLPGDTVRAVAQTRDGYLWVATQAGLARFDGVRFKVFARPAVAEFRTNECNVLLEGRDGSLWIGTIGGGLLRYRDGRFTAYGRAEGLANEVVNQLYEDASGRLWITSYESVTVFDGGRFKSFDTSDAALHVYAVPFHEDAAGRVWLFNARGFGYNNSGALLLYENGELLRGAEAARRFPLPLPRDFSAFAGRGSAFWVNDRGARTLTRHRADGTPDRQSSYGPGDAPALAHEDAHGDLWLVSGGAEMRRASGGRVRREGGAALPPGVVSALHRDREGNVWTGSSAGLTRLRRQAFRAYTTADGLSDETAWTVFEDSRGVVWIGTNSALHRLSGGRFYAYTRRDGLTTGAVVSVAEDADGRLWFGSTLGLTSFKDGRFQTYARGEGLLSENVRGVFVDGRGRLWVGTLGGLHLFEGGRFRPFTTAEGLSHNNVLFIDEDREGSLWIGTPAGLNRLRADRFQVFTTKDGLASNIVLGMHEAADGSLWFGTLGGGLARFRGGKFSSITAAAGLGDDTVTRVLEDGAGNLWMGSTRGVLRASLRELNDFADGARRSFTCVAYGKADGLPTTDCSGGTQPAGFRARDGRLWFPTSKGVAVVDPAALARNEEPPPVRLERLVVDREERPLGAAVALPPGSRAVEFHFTALSFVDPAKVRFRYRLEGFDPDWVDAGARREAFYTNLPPGPYTFRVMAANDDGVWNEQGASLALTLRPYFYQTVWFYLVCAVLLAAAMWGIHLLRVRQLRREFAAVFAERNRIARELHDTLAQGFTGVSMQLEAVNAKMAGAPDSAREHLNRARLLVRSSLAEARRSVRELRSGLLDEDDLAGALSRVARQLTDGGEVRAEVTVAGARRRLPAEVEQNLLRVGQEALTNAVRHAGASLVRADLTFEGKRVRLRVTDDGRGFDPAPNARAPTTAGGFGLPGMRERVAQLGGEFSIESRPGAGTTVSVAVPAGGANGHAR